VNTAAWKVSLADIKGAIAARSDGKRFHYPLHHGSMKVGLYVPQCIDVQQPHTRDELYIVCAGSGEFIKAGTRCRFQQNDVIFVEAGVRHRFENFSEDFAAWVVFWGPEGGEAIAAN